MITAEQIMAKDVVTIGPEATISDAIELMLDRSVSGLPVIDDEGYLVGVITEFALLAMAYDKRITNHTVSEHMTRNVVAVDSSDPVSRVADQFIVHRVRRLPVLNDGRLAGLVSRVDVLRALYSCAAPICTA